MIESKRAKIRKLRRVNRLLNWQKQGRYGVSYETIFQAIKIAISFDCTSMMCLSRGRIMFWKETHKSKDTKGIRITVQDGEYVKTICPREEIE